MSGRNTTARLQRWLQRDPWEPVRWESLAWFCPHPLLRRAKERMQFWPCSSGKRAHRDVPCQPCPPSWGGNTDNKNGLCRRTRRGVPGGAELGITPIPSFPPLLPPPSPAALDCSGSRGYERAVARARYWPGILGPWISLSIVWMQQGLEDEVEMCGALGWVATGTASLGNVTCGGGHQPSQNRNR